MTLQRPSSVLLAKAPDEGEIMEMLRLKHAEDAGGTTFAEASNRSYVKRGIVGEGGCIGVIRGPRRIEATIGIFIGNWCWPITPDEHLYDRWMFVHPAYRRTDHGKHLLDFAQWFSAHCCRPYVSAHIVNSKTAKKNVLYERALGRAYAFVYMFDPSGEVPHNDVEEKGLGISKNAAKRLMRSGHASGLALQRRSA